MTREAKIGMLTGLGVIVLVGVLLSEYLGAPAGTTSTTGRMASLPLGQTYRNEVMQPVGVPGTVRGDAPVASGSLVTGSSQVLPPSMNDVPKAFAAMDTRDMPAIAPPGAPVIGQPVAAVPAGQVQQPMIVDARVPTIDLGDKQPDTMYVAGQPPVAVAPAAVQPLAAAAAAQGDTYMIVSGDSLPKIAKKFYHSSKNSDVQRIVAANPTILKNSSSVLMVGKKLFIPSLPKAATVAVAPPVMMPPAQPVVIAPPGSTPAVVTPRPAVPTTTPTTYVVKNGDSLGKIAHELFPGNATAMVKKIMAANSIKNANDIQVGEKLKIPAKM